MRPKLGRKRYVWNKEAGRLEEWKAPFCELNVSNFLFQEPCAFQAYLKYAEARIRRGTGWEIPQYEDMKRFTEMLDDPSPDPDSYTIGVDTPCKKDETKP